MHTDALFGSNFSRPRKLFANLFVKILVNLIAVFIGGFLFLFSLNASAIPGIVFGQFTGGSDYTVVAVNYQLSILEEQPLTIRQRKNLTSNFGNIFGSYNASDLDVAAKIRKHLADQGKIVYYDNLIEKAESDIAELKIAISAKKIYSDLLGEPKDEEYLPHEVPEKLAKLSIDILYKRLEKEQQFLEQAREERLLTELKDGEVKDDWTNPNTFMFLLVKGKVDDLQNIDVNQIIATTRFGIPDAETGLTIGEKGFGKKTDESLWNIPLKNIGVKIKNLLSTVFRRKSKERFDELSIEKLSGRLELKSFSKKYSSPLSEGEILAMLQGFIRSSGMLDWIQPPTNIRELAKNADAAIKLIQPQLIIGFCQEKMANFYKGLGFEVDCKIDALGICHMHQKFHDFQSKFHKKYQDAANNLNKNFYDQNAWVLTRPRSDIIFESPLAFQAAYTSKSYYFEVLEKGFEEIERTYSKEEQFENLLRLYLDDFESDDPDDMLLEIQGSVDTEIKVDSSFYKSLYPNVLQENYASVIQNQNPKGWLDDAVLACFDHENERGGLLFSLHANPDNSFTLERYRKLGIPPITLQAELLQSTMQNKKTKAVNIHLDYWMMKFDVMQQDYEKDLKIRSIRLRPPIDSEVSEEEIPRYLVELHTNQALLDFPICYGNPELITW